MSAAARLAVSQAEVRTALVDAFALKGFTEPVPVYRIEHTHRTQVMAGQYIVFTDLGGFSKFIGGDQLTVVEGVLDRLLELVDQVCQEFGGTNRYNPGDSYCLTFSDPDRAMAATERLAQEWALYDRRERLGCSLLAALHKGTLYLYRSYLYSADLRTVSAVVTAASRLAGADTSIFVTGQVQQELTKTPWHARLQRVDIGPGDRNHLAEIKVFRLGKLGVDQGISKPSM
jgi:class 3 adenylate cyclase